MYDSEEHILPVAATRSSKLKLESTDKLLTRWGVMAILAIALVGALGANALLITQASFGNVGRMVSINVEVYSDPACTEPVTSLDWGTLTPGENTSKIVYLKNSGNTPIALSMTVGGWDPLEAGSHLSLSWDMEGVSLGEGEPVMATILFSVSPTIKVVHSFSFSIIITGTG
jgi:hypothetical protein